jgi:hypothetical protein
MSNGTINANRYEMVNGSALKVGDTIIRQGYEWVIDSILFLSAEEMAKRFSARHQKQTHQGVYCCKCHWSGNGNNPNYFNNDFSTAQREDIEWTRLTD